MSRMPARRYDFSTVPPPQVQRSVFDRSFTHKTTFDEAYLVPFCLDEILPGDTMTVRAQLLARLSTPIYPLMDNMYLDTFWFFVPSRLLWENWEKFHGARTNPDDDTDHLIPTLDHGEGHSNKFVALGLADYFNLPVNADIAYSEINALPFRAYNLIWNEWFRDENLQDSITVPLDDGPDPWPDDDGMGTEIYKLRRRGKRHDYFTSALPWPQKGDSVLLPLGLSAPVVGDGFAMGLESSFADYRGLMLRTGSIGSSLHIANANGDHAVGDDSSGVSPSTVQEFVGLSSDPNHSHVRVDLQSATAATVNQLRQAFAFQKVLERDARGGTRYVEYLKAHWGVVAPDFRLQRPEYLGGSSQRININIVPQTSGTPSSPSVAPAHTPQGNLAAFGAGTSRSGFVKSFVEHGYIIGLVNVRADITYQQGIHRMWTRSTRFDFPLPALMHLGEQAVLQREIFMPPTSGSGGNPLETDVWGYQERWAEYRYSQNYVTGAFRSNYTGSLDPWHLALDFVSSAPRLNAEFIQDEPPIARVVAVQSEPHFIMDSFIQIKHAREMPVRSVPGMMDRF